MSRRKRLLPTDFIKRLVKKDKSRGRRSDFRLAAAYSRKAGGIWVPFRPRRLQAAFAAVKNVLQSGAREIIIESDVKSKGGKLFYGDSNKGYYHW